ncbi:Uncharacterized protein APZ42_007610 [Daphnia magna]|uniref:MULE transposase domain-containing protein n=1 Tax=Daphnia magna TaxID=35525 RepID=A0A162BU44_9CRUS|nr:Uncharacterized protein APZ42_007610 [Daphnia magna]
MHLRPIVGAKKILSTLWRRQLRGRPTGCFFFVREETGDTIAIGLKQFCENNDNSITQVFLTDKDCAEIAAIRCHFPNAKHLLCHFHALMAVDRRLNETDLSKGFKEEIYQVFHDTVYAQTNEAFIEGQEYLCALGEIIFSDDSLGRYFDTFWFNTDWVTTWPIIHRRNLCTLGDNTTNRIERYHLTIKNVLNRKGRKFNTVLQTLLDIATSRLLDRDMKELENQIRFPTTSFSPLLDKLNMLRSLNNRLRANEPTDLLDGE